MQHHRLSQLLINALPLMAFFPFAMKACLSDIRTHRLPNRLNGLATVATVFTMLLLAFATHSISRLAHATLSGAIAFLVFLSLSLLSRGNLGFGDVKFAVPCGLVLGWYLPSQLLDWLWWSFGLAAMVAVFGILFNRISLQHRLPFGPFMFIGLCLTLATS